MARIAKPKGGRQDCGEENQKIAADFRGLLDDVLDMPLDVKRIRKLTIKDVLLDGRLPDWQADYIRPDSLVPDDLGEYNADEDPRG